jgi:fatty acid desaturase
MDRTDLAPARERGPSVEWQTLALIVTCYGLWFLGGTMLWQHWPAVAVVVVTLTIALHSSLQHEVLHGHPTRNAALNEALVFCSFGLVFPYRRYKRMHLQHHADERLTDPYDDPESYYRALADWERLPSWLRTLLRWNNALVGRMIVGPALMVVGFCASEFRLVVTNKPGVRRAWALHFVGLVPILVIVLGVFAMPLWAYLAAAYAGMSLLAIRTFCEHQWTERPDGRTIIVERSPLSLLFLNNNLHIVHHKLPAAAWYRLPALYRERRDEWQATNGGYVFPNYFAILRAYGFRPKEPVAHPVLRRTSAVGRAFRPRRFKLGLNGGVGAAVPTEPPKE